MGQDGVQVLLAEPARGGGLPQRPVHVRGRVQHGQLDGAGHLGPDPAGSGGGGLGQPQPGAVADGQELRLRPGAGPRRPSRGPGGRGRVVRVVDAGAARGGDPVAGDLGRAVVAGMDDHDLVTVAAGPDSLPGQLVRHRVPAALERHHRQAVGLAGDPERRGERRCRDRVQPGELLGQHVRRDRRVARCGRALTCPQNAPQAASSSAKEE